MKSYAPPSLPPLSGRPLSRDYDRSQYRDTGELHDSAQWTDRRGGGSISISLGARRVLFLRIII